MFKYERVQHKINIGEHMYQCMCNQKYDLPKVAYNIIGLIDDDIPERMVIIQCPNCNNQRIVGGELQYNENPHGEIERQIMMFGSGFMTGEHEQKVWINEDGSLWVKNPRFYANPISP